MSSNTTKKPKEINDLILIRNSEIVESPSEKKKEGKKKKFDISRCSCLPTDNCEVNCVNRGLQIECTIGHCPTGNNCTNNRFQKCIYPQLEIIDAGGKGNGIVTKENLTKGGYYYLNIRINCNIAQLA